MLTERVTTLLHSDHINLVEEFIVKKLMIMLTERVPTALHSAPINFKL